jgi:hypothetical protein
MESSTLGNNLDERGEAGCFLCIWCMSAKKTHDKEALCRKKKHEASTECNDTVKNEEIHRKNE